jgi:hypothetical protein
VQDSAVAIAGTRTSASRSGDSNSAGATLTER